MHCGTHMDAPFHFIPGGSTIDQIPLERCIGPCTFIRLKNCVPHQVIEAEDLEIHFDQLRQRPKVIIETGWYKNWARDNYFSDHPLISGNAAKFLVRCGVHLIGVDTPSVDINPFEAHLEFLSHNVAIIENLTNLEPIHSDVFELIALPLKLTAREASPVRAIAVELA